MTLISRYIEGVLVVKKDVHQPKHEEIPVPNLEVMSCLKSLKSRGYVTEQFSWRHFYFYLTDEGILFLRQYLHLPETVVPITIAKANRAAARTRGDEGENRRGPRANEGEGYRRGGWRGNEQAKTETVKA